jgi:solute carrier family 45 protein 1/2/4
MATWTGHPLIRPSNASEPVQLFLLTCSLIGLQFAWGTEMTYCSPFLLSLGMSKSGLSLVWVAGPLSGLVMQPVIGMVSDRWTGKWGRRRPFMVAGTAGVVLCLLVLGWCGDVVGLFVEDEDTKRSLTIGLAVVDIYLLDFIINVVQSTCRSLIVDTLPVEKQQLGSAWASRMIGLGHMMVYAVGALDLSKILGSTFMGDSQFKKVCAIAALAIAIAQGTTCWAVKERVFVSDGKMVESKSKTALSMAKDLYTTLRTLPPRISAICWVQFWSWIGWFPFLFYGSTWVGEIYLRYDAPSEPSSSNDALADVGRVGSRALIVFSFVSFGLSIILPYLARSPADDEKPPFTPRPPRSLEPVLSKIPPWKSWKPTLPVAWLIANLAFTASMIFAPLVQSVHFATILVAICGLPWAIGGWASFALIGTEINKLSSSSSANGSAYARLSPNEDLELAPSSTLHIRHASDMSTTSSNPDEEEENDDPHNRHSESSTRRGSNSNSNKPTSSSTGEMAGVYLGVLNIFTTLPQFVGTGISTLVFSVLEPGLSPELAQHADPEEHHGKDGVSGIGICLFIGAVCSAWAAWKCRRLD